MLKDVRIHIDSDEQQQKAIEQLSAAPLNKLKNKNLNAFARIMPNIAVQLSELGPTDRSVLIDKNGDVNVVNSQTGRTFYNLNAKKEVLKQASLWSKYQICIDECSECITVLSEPKDINEIPFVAGMKSRSKKSSDMNCLVVLGIGLGWHLEYLITHYQIKHFIIYEPDIALLNCSLMTIDWQNIFELAEKNKTNIYLRSEMDGRDLLKDLQELKSHFKFEGFYFYKHYNHPIFNGLEKDFLTRSWSDIESNGLRLQFESSQEQYVDAWTSPIDIDQVRLILPEDELKLNQNLSALKKYFPNLYKTFVHYKPKYWLPMQHKNGEVLLYNKEFGVFLTDENPTLAGEISYENFYNFPNKDGVVLGYKGEKLKKYEHYQLVQEVQKLTEHLTDVKAFLPESIKSIIMFGIGNKRQLELLITNHTIKNLFVCEPNKDIFYSTLFTMDWPEFCEYFVKNDGRLYLNIGDDGSHLFQDLLNQFYSIGPYILANTYFYQGRYNAQLVQVVSQLREQLQVVISMGEYFDHAYYGINHTKTIIEQGAKFLIAAPVLSYATRECPVFVIGNGPSLDSLLPVVEEYQKEAIIISCGTALLPLIKKGVIPDFHAEIEQNRSTFDWCSRIEDLSVLANISLLSCNGIHPHTAALFKDVYLTFKEGESSTITALDVLKEKDQFVSLKYAFPTVVNFVTNLICQLNMRDIYLFGVDLGFYDHKKHHSIASGYYHQGKEIFDYREKNNANVILKGNFRRFVFSKHEFKVSKEIIEKLISEYKPTFYNCSDGAKIEGSTPLDPKLIIVSSNQSQKENSLIEIKEKAFAKLPEHSKFAERFGNQYQPATVLREIDVFRQKAENVFSSASDIDWLVEEHKKMLFASYSVNKSLLFFYFYGTVNYINSVLDKLAVSRDVNIANQVRLCWLSFIDQSATYIKNKNNLLDSCSSLSLYRETAYISRVQEMAIDLYGNFDLDVYSHHKLPSSCSISLCGRVELSQVQNNKGKYLNVLQNCNLENKDWRSLTEAYDCTLVCYVGIGELTSSCMLKAERKISYCYIYQPETYNLDYYTGVLNGLEPLFFESYIHTYNRRLMLSGIEDYQMLIPKYVYVENRSTNQRLIEKLLHFLSPLEGFYDFGWYIAVPKSHELPYQLVDRLGNLGTYKQRIIQRDDLILKFVTAHDATKIIKNMWGEIC